MKKRKASKVSKKLFPIILGILLIFVLTVLGTYAYFYWSSTSENKDATVSVTSVDALGKCNKITDNQKILWPVSNRNNGRVVTVNAKQTLSEYAYIVWTLTINSINTVDTETNRLKHQSFKYELVNTTTGVSYGSGNFQNLDEEDTITFSNNNENLAYDTNYVFTLYLWIDGTIGVNPSDMIDQTYDFSLVCDITGESTDKTNSEIGFFSGYTVVGNPSIENNRMTSSDGNFVKTPFDFDNDGKAWELRLKANLSSQTGSTYNDLASFVNANNSNVTGFVLELNTGNQLSLFAGSGGSWNIVNGGSINSVGPSIGSLANSDIYVKVGWTGTKYYVSVSPDGINWPSNYRKEWSSTTNIRTGYAIAFGKKYGSSSNAWGYCIYLDSIELDLDGKPYWKAIGN